MRIWGFQILVLEKSSAQRRIAANMGGEIEPQTYVRRWYFTKEEIENCSPSRKDGIDSKTESHLRKLYCAFMQDIGMKLNV